MSIKMELEVSRVRRRQGWTQWKHRSRFVAVLRGISDDVAWRFGIHKSCGCLFLFGRQKALCREHLSEWLERQNP